MLRFVCSIKLPIKRIYSVLKIKIYSIEKFTCARCTLHYESYQIKSKLKVERLNEKLNQTLNSKKKKIVATLVYLM